MSLDLPLAVPARGYGRTLVDLYAAPSDAFADLAQRPRFLVALLAAIALQLVFVGVWLAHVDLYELVRAQMQAAGQPVPPREQLPMGFIRATSWAGAVLGPVVIDLVIALFCMFVFNFLLGAELKFKRALSVVVHASLAVSLVMIPLMLLIFTLKGDWNLPPDTLLQSSLAAFLDRASTPKALYALAGSLEVFSFWIMALMAIGLGKATGRTPGQAAPAVVGLWAVYVVLKVGWTALVG
jgi:hypothetical protein